MMIDDKAFGRIQVQTIPLPDGLEALSGTYTPSGKVLVSYKTAADRDRPDWYNVAIVDDDGAGWRVIFAGEIPCKRKANGIRWMCFTDNRRVLLGDYVLECAPDIDRCAQARLVPLAYPDVLAHGDHIFRHWSEIIIAPDNEHMAWTMLTGDGAINYLGRLVRGEDGYTLADIGIVSTLEGYRPDPVHGGFYIPQPVRGGELKQFVHGGRAMAMVGHGDSITESVVQPLDGGVNIQITDTPGYEETTIFSPDERLGLAMSPRFSPRTDCAAFGLVPQPHSMPTRGKIINVLYMYAVAGVRAFRSGNIGPALIDIERSRALGRAYQGVDLSDPQGRWVYYSPMSWHPDSTRALWNERTRHADGPQQCRLRVCRLLDRQPGAPVPAAATPDPADIPYAIPLDEAHPPATPAFPIRIRGKAAGSVTNDRQAGDPPTYTTTYDGFSDDGETFYQGHIAVTAPEGIFATGQTVFDADLTVTGAHSGEMRLRAVFTRDGVHAPAMLAPESRGFATYDGVTANLADMEP